MPKQNTVFISYRRATSSYIARAIYQALKERGYDVFLDVENIGNGPFAQEILRQIPSRAHFVLVLSPGALDRINEPHDWVCREIQEAIARERNIVPFATHDFVWTAEIEAQLEKAGIEHIKTVNSVPAVHHEWFEEAIDRLCKRYFTTTKLIPIITQTENDLALVEEMREKNEELEQHPLSHLLAQHFYMQASAKRGVQDWEGIILDLDDALKHEPDNAHFLHFRGQTKLRRNDAQGGLYDLHTATQVDPKYAPPYHDIASYQYHCGEYKAAIEDLDIAISLDRELGVAYYTRGLVHQKMGNMGLAIIDFRKADELGYTPEAED